MRRIFGFLAARGRITKDTAPSGHGSVRTVVWHAVLVLLLFSAAVAPVFPQTGVVQAGSTPAAKDQFLTGLVTAIDDESLTVSRAATGKNSATKTFVVNETTRFEGGKPQVRARVTVRYVTTEDGDVAVHVILRRSPK